MSATQTTRHRSLTLKRQIRVCALSSAVGGLVGDGGGDVAFGVGAVADAGQVPVVDDHDVVGVGDAQVGQLAGAVVLTACLPQGTEGGGVGAGLGEEMAPEPEHVRPL